MPLFKFAPSQAKYIYLYKNLRIKVQRCCANIYFYQQCLKQGVVQKYAQIKVPYTSPASMTTQKDPYVCIASCDSIDKIALKMTDQ
jgi:hypothetical protein